MYFNDQGIICLWGLILSLSQVSQLPQLPQKMKFASNVAKIAFKIFISLSQSKSVKRTVLLFEYVVSNLIAVVHVGMSLGLNQCVAK